MRHSTLLLSIIGSAAILGTGCDIVAGIGTYCTEGTEGCGRTGGAGGTSSTTSSVTGGGGTGGSGECTAEVKEACYEGPTGTEAVGACKTGQRTCQNDGYWGPCEGQVTPQAEDCWKPGNDECTGPVGCADVSWGKLYGDAFSQSSSDVAVDSGGDIVVVGYFTGEIDFGGGAMSSPDSDLFVAKFAADGQLVWAKAFVGPGGVSPQAVATGPSKEIVVGGQFTGDMTVGATTRTATDQDAFVFKLSAAGDPQWFRTYGEAFSQLVSDLAVDGNGNVVVGGVGVGMMDFDADIITGAPGGDPFLAKLGPDGTGLWAKRWDDGTDSPGLVSVAVDEQGAIAMAGRYTAPVDLGVGALPADGTAFLAKLTPQGDVSWSKGYPANIGPSGLAFKPGLHLVVAMGASGPIKLGANSEVPVGQSDVFVAELDSLGIYQWSTRIGGAGDEPQASVSVDSQGRPMVALTSDGTIDFGKGEVPCGGAHDLVLAGLESGGALRWARRFGSLKDLISPACAAAQDGGAVFTCEMNGDVDLGKGLLTSKDSDVAVAKLSP